MSTPDLTPEAEALEPLPASEPTTAPLPPGWREDTITSFPAITDATPAPVPAEACRCGTCGIPAEPGKGGRTQPSKDRRCLVRRGSRVQEGDDGMSTFEGASEIGQMETTESAPRRHDDPCRCDEHKYGQRPGTGLVLHTGPDVVSVMIDRALRDGRYEDIEAYVHDAAPLKVHLPAVETARRIRRDVASGYQRICAALDADPRARRDPGLAEAFRRGEDGLGRQLEEMRQWEREYEAWLLTDGRAAA